VTIEDDVQATALKGTRRVTAVIRRLSRRLGEAGIQEKRVAIDEMWFNRLGEVIR